MITSAGTHPSPSRARLEASLTSTRRNRRSFRLLAAVLAAAVVATTAALTPAMSASAALSRVGMISTAGPDAGFPGWYTDSNGLSLTMCLDGAPLCISGEEFLPLHESGGDAEAFYWAADAQVGPFEHHNALEAMFVAEGPDTEAVFMRSQVRAKDANLPPGAVYTITDPYGSFTCTVDDQGEIASSGCRVETTPVELEPERALRGRIGPFLTWDTFADPSLGAPPPEGYIGDNATPHKVVGSPNGFNKVRVEGFGVNADLTMSCSEDYTGPAEDCAETDLFVVQGKVHGGASVVLSSSFVDFGNIGNPDTKKITLTSNGAADVVVDSVAATGSEDFTVSDTCAGETLAAAQSCEIEVTYTPSDVGTDSGTITIADGTPSSPREISLYGSSLPSSYVEQEFGLYFGTQKAGTVSASEIVTVFNSGAQPLTVSSATLNNTTSPQFTIAANRCSVVPADSGCEIEVAFAPSSNGFKTGYLTIRTDANEHVVPLSGQGSTPIVTVTPATMTFSDTSPGSTSAAKTVTLTNSGSATVTIDDVGFTGADADQFALGQNTCTFGANIAPEGSCVAQVLFKPTSDGARTAALTISTDGAVNTVALSGNGSTSGTVTVPGAPAIGTTTAGNGSVTVRWTAPASNGGAAITGYIVRAYNGTDLVRTVPAAGTSVNVTGLTNGTPYTFDVAAINSAGTGAYSSRSTPTTPAVPLTAPGAPAIGATSAGDRTVTVRWTAPANDGGSPITGYTVRAYNGTEVAGSTPAAPGATSVDVTGLINGTAYTFEVAAINSVGTSAYSGRTTATTPAAPVTAPGAPTIGTTTAGNGSAIVRWTAPANDGGAGITGYTVRAFDGSTEVSSTNAVSGATSVSVTGLTNGTAYTFDVAARNSAGTGDYSARSATTTPAAPVTVPGSPTIHAPTRGDASATVSWTAPANTGGAPITGYTVRVLEGTTGTTPVQTVPVGAVTSTVITGLTNGSPYTFTVAAINSAGTGVFSLRSVQVTPAAPTPTDTVAPTIAVRSPESGAGGVSNTANVSVTFSEAVTGVSTTTLTLRSAAGATVSGTTVSYDAATRTATLDPGGATAANLANDTRYTVALTNAIRDAAGNPLAATSWTFVTGPAPTISARTPAVDATGVARSSNVTVTFSEAVQGLSSSSIVLQQLSATDTVVSTVTGTVSYNTTTRVGTFNPYGTSATVLAAGTRYRVTINAGIRDNAGNPLAPVDWIFTTEGAAATVTVPGAPTIGTTTAGDASVTVRWTAPANTGGATLTGYSVRTWSGATLVRTTPVADGAASSTVIGTLTNGTAYTFDVAAVNSAGTGAYSARSGAATPVAAAPADTVAPTITARTPGVNATGVARNSNVSVTFSEAVTGMTASSITVQQLNSAGAVVATVSGTPSYNSTTRVGSFNPFGTSSTVLLANTRYRVTINNGIRDSAGNPLASTSWIFTTGAN